MTPDTDAEWTYKREYQGSTGAVKIKEKTNDRGFSYVDEYYASGITPSSPAVALRILRKAARSIGIDQHLLQDVFGYDT